MGSPSDYEELHLHAVGDSHIALRNLSLKRNGTGASILPGNGEVVVTDGDGATGWLLPGNPPCKPHEWHRVPPRL